VAPAADVARLRALALSIEGRYTFLPGAYVAARAEHLGFNRITGSNGPQTWDANVRRFEIGGGYYLQRNVIARVSWQYNQRDTARFNRGRFVAAQLLFWF
jgi:predicted porin